jgi:hypothetical protein
MDDDTVHIDSLTVPAGAPAETLAQLLRAQGVSEDLLSDAAAAVRDAIGDAVHRGT